MLFGDRLLPDREAQTFVRDLSQLPDTLRQDYVYQEELARLDVPAGSALVGQRASMIEFFGGKVTHLPLRDPVTLVPLN